MLKLSNYHVAWFPLSNAEFLCFRLANYKFIIKIILRFLYQKKFFKLRNLEDRRHVARYYLLILFKFKYKIRIILMKDLYDASQVIFHASRASLLKILFSSRIIVGLSMYFREYLWMYTNCIKFLIYAKQKNFDYKIFLLLCLNFQFINNESLLINYNLFLFYELFRYKIECSVFNAAFFNYCLFLGKDNVKLFIINNTDFFMKITLKAFLYFFRYIEHFRISKYNEYIIGHFGLGGNYNKYLLRKSYIVLYYYWALSADSLDACFTFGFRKALVQRVYILCLTFPLVEDKMIFFFTQFELRSLFFSSHFMFLYFLQYIKPFNRFLYQLNRQSIRHSLRFWTYMLIMQKDRKWKWFHHLSFETILDLIFSAFKPVYSIPVFTTLIKFSERKIFNWHLRQSAVYTNYFLIDLLMFKHTWAEEAYDDTDGIWYLYYWNEIFFYMQLFQISVTNIISDFFIRVVGQLDACNSNFVSDMTYQFYVRYRYEFFQKILFYCFPCEGVVAELFFGVDYFLWRIWYSYSYPNYTLESYLFTATYDKLLFSRYLVVVRLFQKIFKSDPPNSFNLNLVSLYLLLRDLFYKNIKNNSKIILLFFFLKLYPIHTKHKFFYDWILKTGVNLFILVAPGYERNIDLRYITAPSLVKWKISCKVKKKLNNLC